MNDVTVDILTSINAAFYEQQHASFSATRDAPWPGWERCDGLWGDVVSDGKTVNVLDLACGNLRFERFLAAAHPDVPMRILAVDACDELAAEALGGMADAAGPGAGEVHDRSAVFGSRVCAAEDARAVHDVTYAHADLVDNVRASRPLVGRAPERKPEESSAPEAPGPFDIVVSFGFMHHIPSYELRERFLGQALGQLSAGGVCAVSLWRFLDDARLAAKADRDHDRAMDELGLASRPDVELEPGDRIIGWQGRKGAWRYCHGFSDDEADRLVVYAADRAELVARFDADGKSGRLNTYLVFRR
jgi:tRNA (uracil-5-)-methyltransferase TRM9